MPVTPPVENGIDTTDSDADYWVRILQLTEYGDATLDRVVNFNDLLALAESYNAPATGWQQGNFNGDASTNFTDLLLLAKHYGFGTLNLSPDDFDADWALAQSLVPEPTLLGGIALFAVPGRRRRSPVSGIV